MTRMKLLFNTLAVLVVCLACSTLAQAQATRTWVSGVGDDANPCSRTAPCKTFAGAISKTAEGGEIDVLDPGGFGGVTITKSITIDGTTGAGFGSILAAGFNGVIVNVTTNPTTAVVTLRNLYINGTKNGISPGPNGIRFIAGKVLHVEKCAIFGFSTTGIDVNNTTTNPTVVIEDTNISNIGTTGISLTATTGLGVVIRNTTVKQSGTGISAGANSRVSVEGSNLSANSTGLGTASGSESNLTETLVAGNGTGVNLVSGATVRLGNCTVAQTLTGVANTVGTVQSTGDSRFMGNLTDRTGPAFSPLVKQ